MSTYKTYQVSPWEYEDRNSLFLKPQLTDSMGSSILKYEAKMTDVLPPYNIHLKSSRRRSQSLDTYPVALYQSKQIDYSHIHYYKKKLQFQAVKLVQISSKIKRMQLKDASILIQNEFSKIIDVRNFQQIKISKNNIFGKSLSSLEVSHSSLLDSNQIPLEFEDQAFNCLNNIYCTSVIINSFGQKPLKSLFNKSKLSVPSTIKNSQLKLIPNSSDLNQYQSYEEFIQPQMFLLIAQNRMTTHELYSICVKNQEEFSCESQEQDLKQSHPNEEAFQRIFRKLKDYIIISNEYYSIKMFFKSVILKRKSRCKLCEKLFYDVKFSDHVQICLKKEKMKVNIIFNQKKISEIICQVERFSQKLHHQIFESFKNQSIKVCEGSQAPSNQNTIFQHKYESKKEIQTHSDHLTSEFFMILSQCLKDLKKYQREIQVMPFIINYDVLMSTQLKNFSYQIKQFSICEFHNLLDQIKELVTKKKTSLENFQKLERLDDRNKKLVFRDITVVKNVAKNRSSSYIAELSPILDQKKIEHVNCKDMDEDVIIDFINFEKRVSQGSICFDTESQESLRHIGFQSASKHNNQDRKSKFKEISDDESIDLKESVSDIIERDLKHNVRKSDFEHNKLVENQFKKITNNRGFSRQKKLTAEDQSLIFNSIDLAYEELKKQAEGNYIDNFDYKKSIPEEDEDINEENSSGKSWAKKSGQKIVEILSQKINDSLKELPPNEEDNEKQDYQENINVKAPQNIYQLKMQKSQVLSMSSQISSDQEITLQSFQDKLYNQDRPNSDTQNEKFYNYTSAIQQPNSTNCFEETDGLNPAQKKNRKMSKKSANKQDEFQTDVSCDDPRSVKDLSDLNLEKKDLEDLRVAKQKKEIITNLKNQQAKFEEIELLKAKNGQPQSAFKQNAIKFYEQMNKCSLQNAFVEEYNSSCDLKSIKSAESTNKKQIKLNNISKQKQKGDTAKINSLKLATKVFQFSKKMKQLTNPILKMSKTKQDLKNSPHLLSLVEKCTVTHDDSPKLTELLSQLEDNIKKSNLVKSNEQQRSGGMLDRIHEIKELQSSEITEQDQKNAQSLQKRTNKKRKTLQSPGPVFQEDNLTFESLSKKQIQQNLEQQQQRISPEYISKVRAKYIHDYNIWHHLSQSDSGVYFKESHDLFYNSQVSVNDFEVLKRLGKGAFGKVYLVRKKATKDLYAMKCIKFDEKLSKNYIQSLMNERNIFNVLKGNFTVKCLFTFIWRNFVVFVMDYMPGRDLRYLLDQEGYFEHEQAKFYAAEIAVGIHELHSSGVLHRDIKPENILIDENGHIRLTDFGLSELKSKLKLHRVGESQLQQREIITKHIKLKVASRALEDFGDFGKTYQAKPKDHEFQKFQNQLQKKRESKMHICSIDTQSIDDSSVRIIGTPDYIAPEMIKGKKVTTSNDWWALGCVIYEMLIGINPFNDKTIEKVFQNITERKIEWIEIVPDDQKQDEDQKLARSSYNIINELFVDNPAKRLGSGMAGFLKVKNHPFFKGVDFDKLISQQPPIKPEVPDRNHLMYKAKAEPVEKILKQDFEIINNQDIINPNLQSFNFKRNDLLMEQNNHVVHQIKKQINDHQDNMRKVAARLNNYCQANNFMFIIK